MAKLQYKYIFVSTKYIYDIYVRQMQIIDVNIP